MPVSTTAAITMEQRKSLAARDLDALFHPTTNLKAHRETGPMVVDRGRGVYVYDEHGREYIEGLAGLWCTALGYGVEELVETAREQMAKMSYTHLFGGKSNEPAIRLAEKLKAMSPIDTGKVFFGNSGSDANDTQIKLVRYYNNALGRPRKKKIISRKRAYHGVTMGAGSLTGLPVNHAMFDLPIDGVLHTDCPHHYRDAEPGETPEAFATRLAERLEALIEREDPATIAAFIAEPVMGAGGVVVPPPTYFEKIQAVLRRHDILFIDDEVICGFGRTGAQFGAQTFGLHADTMSLAKGLSSGYLPISAVLVPEWMFEASVEPSARHGAFGHGFTYSGHPVACAVALKNLELMQEWDILGHVARVGPIFQARLNAFADHPLVGEARGVGLIGAIELVADKATGSPFDPVGQVGVRCAALCQQEGLIVRNLGDSIAFCPPLVITEGEIGELFDRFERTLGKM